MKIKKVSIQNFRGIKTLDWVLNPHDSLVCIIGHGDSSKSSILKAMEYALSPKWNLPIQDSDFYDCDPTNEINIEITIGNLSDQLLEDLVANYRYFKNGEFRNLESKQDDDELVITVVLHINGDLDPFWGIADSEGNVDEDDKLPISIRKLLNLVRLDKDASNIFHWKYDSPLLKSISKEKRQEIKSKLVEIGRKAREGFDKETLPQEIKDQASEIEGIARSLAVGHEDFFPNVDVFSADAICLHRGFIPIYMLGDGSKKIAALAIGKYLINKSKEEEQDGGIIIFDEIENSLEPHRLRYIISTFLKDSNESKYQTFLSTHSPITVEELGTKEGLYIVRNNPNGEVKIHRIPKECLATVRRHSEFLFSKKIVVCEGKTEFGLLKAFGRHWAKKDNRKNPPEQLGIALFDGKGSEMHKYMKKFIDMGFDLCVYKDNDQADAKISAKASELGVQIFQYPNGYRTEKIIFKESPKSLQDNLIDIFNSNKTDAVPNIDKKDSYDSSSIDYVEQMFHDSKRKTPSGTVNGMFRTIDHAEELGEIIIEQWSSFLGTSDFRKTITDIENWIYA